MFATVTHMGYIYQTKNITLILYRGRSGKEMKKLRATIALALAFSCLFAMNAMAAGTFALGLSASRNRKW